MRRSIMIFMILAGVFQAFSQLSIPGKPLSSGRYRGQVITVANPDMRALAMEDSLYPSPYRYGTLLPVDLDIRTSGEWEKVPGGDVWRASIHSPGALAIAIYFDRFNIPDGGKLFLYDPQQRKVIGAFTSVNNSEEGLFATELIPGDTIIFEYFRPSGFPAIPDLHVNEISYAYRGVTFRGRGFGGSGPCEVNVNCSEGWQWSEQIKGVALIGIRKGTANFWCTGSLVSNVREDKTPYFLTADHCGEGATPENILQWVFYFHYKSPECEDPLVPPIPRSMTGAVMRAHGGNSGSTGSDFFLVEMVENIPEAYDVFFNGWNREEPSGNSGVCIHHPMGDIMKISTFTGGLHSTAYGGNPQECFWRVRWTSTPNGHGVTEGGSSGSPVFDADRLLVGTLTGGTSSCDSAHLTDADYYGKFSWHWESNGTDSSARLRDWLDPDNTGTTKMNGYPNAIAALMTPASFSVFPNPCNGSINVLFRKDHPLNGSVYLYNSIGILVARQELLIKADNTARIGLEGVSAGFYILKIDSEKSVFISKINVQ